jgi:hypothetical protein
MYVNFYYRLIQTLFLLTCLNGKLKVAGIQQKLIFGSAAADNAWTKLLSKCLKASEKKELQLLFSETECVERREFSVLHKIVLRIIQKDLEQELLASTHNSVSAHMSASKHNRRCHTLLLAHAQPSPAHSRS